MTKMCPLCNQPVKTGDIVIALMLAKFKEQEQGYELQTMAQTISSHVYCLEQKPVDTQEVK